jgi:hypothetical protein
MGLFFWFGNALRVLARRFRTKLRRILRRFLVVVFGHLQIMLRRHLRAVADPLADDVNRVGLGQFRFPRAATILHELRPGLEPRPLDNLPQQGPQVLPLPVSRDNILHAGFGLLKDLYQVGVEFREDGNLANTAVGVVFGFAGVNGETCAEQRQRIILDAYYFSNTSNADRKKLIQK